MKKSPCTIPCRTIHTKTKFLASSREKQDKHFRLRSPFINHQFPEQRRIALVLSKILALYQFPKHYHFVLNRLSIPFTQHDSHTCQVVLHS